MRFLFPLLLFLIIMPVASADVIINEIMYDDIGSDAGKEWVELYNNGTDDINLSNAKFVESGTNHNLVLKQGGVIVPGGSYAIIAENWSAFLLQHAGYTGILFDSSFDLHNTNETIAINGSLVNVFDEVSYLKTWGANGTGKTLERNASGWFESIELGGTPGAENSISIPSNSTDIGDENTQNQNNAQSTHQSTKIEILRSPPSMKFGDFGTIQARFLSGSRSFSKMRFVAYVYSPVWIANDLTREENTLRNAPYNAIVAAELEGIEADTTHNLLLPLILKCNPDGKYADGSYTVRVRGYSLNDGSWSDIAEKDTQISVRGENELCDKEMCKSESVGGNKTEKEGCSLEERESGSFDANITVPDAAFIGRNFTTKILLKNRINSSLDLELYTYLYEHSTIMSQGWSGEKWGNARASNSRKVSLEPHGSAVIELVSMPRGNISAEKYTFKVEIDDLNDRKNSREFVYLVKVEEAPADEKTGSIINESGKGEENKITGNIIGENSESSFWEKIIEKIKHWLKM